MSDLNTVRDRMREFTERRGWAQFHDPKSLLLALVGEVGELAELFQWLPADQATSEAREGPLRERVEEELADVFVYLVRLSDVLGVDLASAALRKLAQTEDRYPIESVYGVAPTKHDAD